MLKMETKIHFLYPLNTTSQYQSNLLNSFDLVDNNNTSGGGSGGSKKDDAYLINSINNQLDMQTSLLDTLQLNKECDRLKSFANWNVEFIAASQLALFGFYYLGPRDMVKCHFCHVEIGMWERDDNILNEHLRWSQFCPLVNRRNTDNIPLIPGQLEAILPPQTIDVCGIRIRHAAVPESSMIREPEADEIPMNHHHQPQQQQQQQLPQQQPQQIHHQPQQQHQEQDEQVQEHPLLGHSLNPVFQPNIISTNNTLRRPEHPEYAVEARRIKSFEDWPRTIKQKPAELSDAGFFYTGKGDRVICFSCGGGLKDWEETDNPWEQHATWYSQCEYLKLMKGDLYIKQVFLNLLARGEESAASGGSGSETAPGSSCAAEEAQSGLGSLLKRQGSSSSSDNDDQEERNSKRREEKLCKICYENEYNTAFTPCGHVIACAKCASSVTKCPSCRQPFTNVMRVYFS